MMQPFGLGSRNPNQLPSGSILALVLLLAACAAPSGTVEPGPPTLQQLAAGELTVVDLGHSLNAANPYWPGEGYKPFAFEVIADLESDGVFSGAFSTPEHLGTHLDAPNHFEEGRASVDEIPLERLVAPLAVVDIRRQCADDADYELTPGDIEEWESQHGPLPENSVIAALTGWSRRWEDFELYKNSDDNGLHFPGFSVEAATMLVERRSVVGLVIDTLSVDFGQSQQFQVHHVSNAAGLYHIENAANLEQIPAAGSFILIAPIKIEGGSGGPARAWAVF